MSSYFSVKTNKGKVRKCLKCVREFLRRFDLANGKYLSIFLGVFARITKITHFAQVINFRERIYDKVHPSKVDKNREPMVFFVCFFVFVFVFFFNTTAKQSRILSILHLINLKYIKQWVICHFQTYI